MGQPLTAADISFYNDERGLGAMAKLDSLGKFTFSAPLPVGDYAVRVMPPSPDPIRDRNKALPPSPIPQKYREIRTSGLTFSVREGKNDFSVELKNE